MNFTHKNDSNKKLNFISIASSFNGDIRQSYKFIEVLGGGQFGTVRSAHKLDNESKLFAVKSIAKKNLTEKDIEALIKEVEIISSLDHPNIIKFYETYNDQYYFHFVMELCLGKEVFDRIIEEKAINEFKVANIVYKVVSSIFYCHNNGISHRDIKPENILFETDQPDSEIKLIDFGLSANFDKDKRMNTVLGTPYYMAPEVLQGEYNQKCDMWSIGAITYTMLSGEPPFFAENASDMFLKIKTEKLKFRPKKWKNISQNCINFITQCMDKDPYTRLSSEEAIEHPWFKDILTDLHKSDNIDIEMLENLRNFSSPSRFKRLVLKFLINQLSLTDLAKLRQSFNAIDLNHHGTINLNELENAFKLAKIEVSETELQNILDMADARDNGVIDYSEFLVACVNRHKIIDKEKLIYAFNYFDVDCSGYICQTDIKNAFMRAGRKILDEQEIDNMILEVTNDRDKISLEEFLNLFNI